MARMTPGARDKPADKTCEGDSPNLRSRGENRHRDTVMIKCGVRSGCEGLWGHPTEVTPGVWRIQEGNSPNLRSEAASGWVMWGWEREQDAGIESPAEGGTRAGHGVGSWERTERGALFEFPRAALGGPQPGWSKTQKLVLTEFKVLA